MSEPDNEWQPWFVVGAVLGGAVGLVLGLLTAPGPGAQTRQALAEQSDAWRHRLTEKAETPPVAPDGQV